MSTSENSGRHLKTGWLPDRKYVSSDDTVTQNVFTKSVIDYIPAGLAQDFKKELDMKTFRPGSKRKKSYRKTNEKDNCSKPLPLSKEDMNIEQQTATDCWSNASQLSTSQMNQRKPNTGGFYRII